VTIKAELIDIDFLCYLVDESYEGTIDGDVVTFHHPRRGKLTALQSGRVALLIQGDLEDRRGLPATADLHAFTPPFSEAPRGLPGVVIPFPSQMPQEVFHPA